MHIALKITIAIAIVPVLVAVALSIARLRPSAGVNHAEVVIAAAPSAVWRHMTDPALTKAWVGGLVEIEGLTPGGLAVGARDRLVVEMGGRRSAMFSEIVALEPERRLDQRLRADEGAPFVEEVSFTLHPEGAGTRFVMHANTVYTSAMGKLFEPLITRMAQAKIVGDLERLKANVEAG